MRTACAKMRLDLASFLAHPGRHIPFAIDVDAERASAKLGEAKFVTAIHVAGEAFVQLATLYLRVKIHAVVEQPCSRCLTPVRSTIDLAEGFTVPIGATDTSTDLLPQIIAFIRNSLDPRPLCRPDCKGLCPVCGINLNEHPDHVCPQLEKDRLRLGDFLK